MSSKEQLARWAEHFKELLNRPPPDVTPEINRADEELKINLNLKNYTMHTKIYMYIRDLDYFCIALYI